MIRIPHGRLAAVVGVLLGLLLAVQQAIPAQTFVKRPRLFRVGPNPSAIAAADLNGDGLPELVTADTGTMTDPREERPANDEVSLLLAQPNLDYVKHAPSLKTGFAPYAIALANIDALKWLDIVVVNFHAVRHRDVMLYRNLQDNLFETLSFRVPDEALSYQREVDGDGQPLFVRPGLTSVVIHDFNRDGYRDLLATGWSSDVLVFMPGHPELYFGEPVFTEAKGGPRDLQLADFDGDGTMDVAVSLYAAGQVGLWKWKGDGVFEAVSSFPTRGRLPHKLRARDVNGDGRTDIVVSHRYADDSIVIFYGDGGFRFSVSQEIMLGKDRQVLEQDIRDIVVEDFNQDGRMDIAAACFGAGQVAVLMNTTQAGAHERSFDRENYALGKGKPRALCATDLNLDGKPDLAVALWEEDAVGLLVAK